MLDRAQLDRLALAAERRHVARLLAPWLAELVRDLELPSILTRTAARSLLRDLWDQTGCASRYGFAVRPSDIDPIGAAPAAATGVPAARLPILDDAALSYVSAGARGTAHFVAALAWSGAEGRCRREVPVVVHVREALSARVRWDRCADARGLYRAARALAALLSPDAPNPLVTPRHLVAALALALTSSMASAIEAGGLSPNALLEERARLVQRLSPEQLAGVQTLLLLPPWLVPDPADWRLDAVQPADRVQLAGLPFTDLLPELGVHWLGQQMLHHLAALPGIERLPLDAVESLDERPAPGLRRFVDAHVSWPSLWSEVAHATGWATPLERLKGAPLGSLVERAAERAGRAATPVRVERRAAHRDDATETYPHVLSYAEIRARLRSRVTGQDEVIDRLSLAAHLHLRGVGNNVLLLVGPAGVGKSYLMRALAAALEVPFASLDCSTLTPTGWAGADFNDVLVRLWHAAGNDPERMQRGVVLLDEVDALRAVPGEVDPVAATHREGAQRSLLNALGGVLPSTFPIPSSTRGRDAEVTVETKRLLVVLAGAFTRCDWRTEPSTEQLVTEGGLIQELAERIRERILIPPRTLAELVQLFRTSPDGPAAVLGPVYAEAGWTLEIPEATYACAAAAVVRGDGGLGPRSGLELLARAARARLIALLNASAPEGTIVTLAPDDLALPRSRRGSAERPGDPDRPSDDPPDEGWRPDGPPRPRAR